MENNSFLSHEELLQREEKISELQEAFLTLKIDVLKGRQRLEELANSGSVLSMMYLGESYRTQSPIDHDKSKYWYLKAFEHKSVNAIFNLGTLCYSRGELDESVPVLREGLHVGDGPSIYWLAKLYEHVPELGSDADEVERLFKLAAEKGQVKAKNHLAFLYMKGRYGWANMFLGLRYYLESLIEGFKIGFKNPKDRRLW